MSLTPEIIARTARLAQLSLDAEEKQSMHSELNKILDFVADLESVDTTGIEPLEHPLEMLQPLRADQATESNIRDQVQAIAPDTKDGLYLVPAVIDSPKDN
jgi:aspartyl-tRNA(Asn)/glutamyl-tRNA(Gln) amidotransferase subunit C